jgi:glycosyltransferase involved in cell wall biosynthesis
VKLVQQIVQPGIEVKLICNSKILNEKYINNLSNCLIEPIFKYKKSSNFLLKSFSYSISYTKIIALLLIDRPDLVHIQWIKLPLLDITFIILLKVLRIPSVYTSHNFLPHTQNFLSFFFAKIVCRSVNKIIVHSKATKDLLIRNFGCSLNKVYTIPYGNLSPLPQISKVLLNKTGNNIDDSRLIFGIFGSIRVNKGILEYLKAWSFVASSRKDILCKVTLRIIGEWDRGYFVKVNEFIEDNNLTNVFIENKWLSNQEFEKEILNSDVCVLPYLDMSQSAFLMTLISYQKPCVVSNVGGLPDPFDVAKIGWVFSWDEDLSLVAEKAILKPILELTSGWHPSSEDWQAVDQHFSWSRAGKATASLYRELLTNWN